jgi:hypothetical protein
MVSPSSIEPPTSAAVETGCMPTILVGRCFGDLAA